MARFFLSKSERYQYLHLNLEVIVMLQHLHEKIHGWLAWFVVGLIGITFVFFGASYYSGGRATSDVKAVVNGEDITFSEFDTTYRRLKRSTTEFTASSESLLKKQALNELIYEKVMQQAGAHNGYYVSTKQAQDEIIATPDFQEGGQFSTEKFQQLLSSNLLTQSDYLSLLKTGMVNQQLRFSFIGTSFILPNELQRFVKYSNQKRDYEYLIISPKNFTIQSPITEQQLLDYYQAHLNEFQTKAKIAVEYVFLSMKDEVAESKLEPGEAEAFYKENQANYMKPAKYKFKSIFIQGDFGKDGAPSKVLQDRLASLIKSLKTESFEVVAKQYSDDLLASKTKSLKWLSASALDKHLQTALMKMSPNQVSKPIYTDKGIEVVKLIAKKEPKLTPFNLVKPSIEQNLLSEKGQKIFQQKAEQLADLSYQNPDNLTTVSSALNLKVMTTPLVEQQQGFPEPLNKSKVMKAALSDEVLKDANNSQPIQLNDDAMIVLRVKEFQKSQTKSFDMVKAEISSILTEQALQKLAQDTTSALVKALKENHLTQADKILSENHLQWKKVTSGLRTKADRTEQLVNDFAFELPMSGSKPAIEQKSLADGQLAVIKLTSVVEGQISDVDSDQLKLIHNQLASAEGIKAYELYLQSLRRTAKVKVEEQ